MASLFFIFLRQGIPYSSGWPQLSCLRLPSAKITGMCHQALLALSDNDIHLVPTIVVVKTAFQVDRYDYSLLSKINRHREAEPKQRVQAADHPVLCSFQYASIIVSMLQ